MINRLLKYYFKDDPLNKWFIILNGGMVFLKEISLFIIYLLAGLRSGWIEGEAYIGWFWIELFFFFRLFPIIVIIFIIYGIFKKCVNLKVFFKMIISISVILIFNMIIGVIFGGFLQILGY